MELSGRETTSPCCEGKIQDSCSLWRQVSCRRSMWRCKRMRLKKNDSYVDFVLIFKGRGVKSWCHGSGKELWGKSLAPLDFLAQLHFTLYFWSEGQSSQHSSIPFPSNALYLSMFIKWAFFHTHIQFVLQKHWCHTCQLAPQPIPFISYCENNYLELSFFFVKIFIPSQISHQSRMTGSKGNTDILCLHCT